MCNCAEPFSGSRRVWGCWLLAWRSGCHTRRMRGLHKHVFVLYSICTASAAHKRWQATPHPGQRVLAHCHRACMPEYMPASIARVESHMMHHVSVDAHALHHMVISSCSDWEHDSCHLPLRLRLCTTLPVAFIYCVRLARSYSLVILGKLQVHAPLSCRAHVHYLHTTFKLTASIWIHPQMFCK